MHDCAGEFALDRSKDPQIIVEFSELFLSFTVVVKCFFEEVEDEMVIGTYFEASVLFLLLYGLRIEFILHPVKHDGPVILVILLGLCDEVADL